MNQFLAGGRIKVYNIMPVAMRKTLLRIWFKKRNTTPKEAFSFGVPLVEHCNLKCKGCDHFSPLAEESELDIVELRKDLQRMRELFGGGHITEVLLLGGEPLLHSNIVEIMKESRAIFPEIPIKVLTNGVKLNAMGDIFWDTCAESGIEIMVTKYPINLSFDEIEEKARKRGVRFNYYNNSDKVKKTLYKEPLDLKGSQKPEESFSCCSRAHCLTLKNGKLYHCTLIPSINNFANYFKENFQIDESDYADIYATDNKDDILRKLALPGKFCRYCDIGHNEFGLKWEQSKRDISEWI